MKSMITFAIISGVLGVAAIPAGATLPIPAQSAATSSATAFLFHAGAGDIFEITSSMTLMGKSRNPALRAYAAKLIDDHTRMTNMALTTARAAGVAAPPPELSPAQKADLAALRNSDAASLDRRFITQQVAAHRQALALMQGYARGGDQPALRQVAQGAIPAIQSHLAEAEGMMAAMPR